MILVTDLNGVVVIIRTVLRHVSSILSQPQMAAAPELGSLDKHDVQVCMPSSCVAAMACYTSDALSGCTARPLQCVNGKLVASSWSWFECFRHTPSIWKLNFESSTSACCSSSSTFSA